VKVCGYEPEKSGCAVQKRALAKCRIAVNRLDQTISKSFSVQSEEPGKFPHAFAMGQPDDDGASIRWHSHK
jgi:hypothetical protein